MLSTTGEFCNVIIDYGLNVSSVNQTNKNSEFDLQTEIFATTPESRGDARTGLPILFFLRAT